MVENYEFFLSQDIYTPDFSLVRDDVWTKEDIIVFRENCIKLADRYIEEVKKGTYTTIGFFRLHILDAIFGYTYGKRPFSCFAGTHGAVLTSQGEFYPCARFAPKKIMKMDEDFEFSYWQEKLNPQNFDKCKSCDLYQVCNMGCTYSQIINDNKPLDSVCELFHIIEEQTHRIVNELRDNPTFAKIVGDSLKMLKG
jgi:radical SAM protein with 4Fe4S-binding SPASM domain